MKEVEFIVMTFGLIVKIASADNYISSAMVEKLGLTQHVQRVDSSVKVADGRYIKIDGKINLMIRFKNRDGEYVMARLDLYLLEGLSLSIVIGIRSILDHFRPIFIDMLLQDSEDNDEVAQMKALELISPQDGTQILSSPDVFRKSWQPATKKVMSSS